MECHRRQLGSDEGEEHVGWYSVYNALIYGKEAHGTVKDAIKGEVEPLKMLETAMREIKRANPKLSRGASIRIAYWRRKLQRESNRDN